MCDPSVSFGSRRSARDGDVGKVFRAVLALKQAHALLMAGCKSAIGDALERHTIGLAHPAHRGMAIAGQKPAVVDEPIARAGVSAPVDESVLVGEQRDLVGA